MGSEMCIRDSDWDKGSGKILGAISKGLPFYTLGITGYVDVRDVVEGMLRATNGERWGERFILSASNHTHREVFTLIAGAMQVKPPGIRVAPWVSNLVWPLAWLWGVITTGTPIITRATAQGGHKVTKYSSQRAQNELGIIFRPISEAITNAVGAGCLAKIKK